MAFRFNRNDENVTGLNQVVSLLTHQTADSSINRFELLSIEFGALTKFRFRVNERQICLFTGENGVDDV